MTPLPGQLDGDRRIVLQELISLLTAMVAEAQVVTGAVLDFDLVSLAEASATLAQMSADPVLDLGRTTDVYRALRRAIVERQQARRVAPSVRSSMVAPRSLPDVGSSGPPAGRWPVPGVAPY